ncbi:alpha/beta hydrolase [Rothia sp. P5766]|uniref:alpha/beta hydrolase n=3 Tax=unclassified Rothia (in: high G+C Gram-positive bacteria) TaxID=2689056 RepID=UPI003AEEB0E0
MSTRPSDWSPLAGGDPCPGDPDAWISISNFWWEQRNYLIDPYRESLLEYTSIDGEGNRIRRLEAVASDGAGLVSRIAYAYEKASDAVSRWKRQLRDMQERADAALKSAQDAQTAKNDAQDKIARLEEEAAKDESPDPIIALTIHGWTGHGGLRGDIADADAAIANAQRIVDDIRDEYFTKASEIIEQYSIADSVDALYNNRGGTPHQGNPFSAPSDVLTSFELFDSLTLIRAFEDARTSEENMPRLLDLLSQMTPEQIQTFFTANPKYALFASNPIGGDNVQRAKDTQKWWNAQNQFTDDKGNWRSINADDQVPPGTLNEAQRKALIQYAPGLVGNMQGIQYTYRSEANVNLVRILSQDSEEARNLERVDGLKLPDSPFNLEKLHLPDNVRGTARNMLKQYEENKANYPDVQIITFEVSTGSLDEEHWDDVKAAFVLGNLDKAESISYLTHGIDNSALRDSDVNSHIRSAGSLYKAEESAIIHHGNIITGNGSAPQHATVAWMNYEAPKGPAEDLSVLDNDKAHEGGHRYAQDLDTLNTLRGEDNIRLNTVAHSYGTDTTFSGMTEMKTQVDSAVFLGSAGLDQKQVDDVQAHPDHLAVDINNIAYTHASEDIVAPMGYLKFWNKTNPSDILTPDGAKPTELTSDGGYTQDGNYLQDTDGHALYDEDGLEGYLKPGTSALDQTALWTTGHRDKIGRLLEYVDPSDFTEIKSVGPNNYTYVPANDRKTPVSQEELREYARARGINWEDVQKTE